MLVGSAIISGNGFSIGSWLPDAKAEENKAAGYWLVEDKKGGEVEHARTAFPFCWSECTSE